MIKGDETVYVSIIFALVILLIFSLFGLVKSCKNINKFNRAKEIDILKNYDTIRIINLLYVIFGFMIFVLLIAYPLAEYIIRNCKKYQISFKSNNYSIRHEPAKNDLNETPNTTNTIPTEGKNI